MNQRLTNLTVELGWPCVPPTASAHSSTCVDLLHGAGVVPGNAYAPEGCQALGVTQHAAGAAQTNSSADRRDKRGPNNHRVDRDYPRAEVAVCSPGVNTTNPFRPRQTRFVVCALKSVSIEIKHLRSGSVELVQHGCVHATGLVNKLKQPSRWRCSTECSVLDARTPSAFQP